MSDKKTRKLLDRIENLERENRNLKKRVGQYRKLVLKSADILLDKSEDLAKPVKKYKIKKCEQCGKGDVREVNILEFYFEICQLCKYKKKL